MKKRVLLSGGSNAINYISAIQGVGGEAVAIYAPAVDTSYDGLILCGGSDIHPKHYNEEIAGSVGIDEKRDAAEFAL